MIKQAPLITDSLFKTLPPPLKDIIGHRGSAGLAPENTLASFKIAAELGLSWVEFDVQRCASGEWVVFHDETIERTTNGQGKVSELPYYHLRTLDAGSWFSAKFNQERIPTLFETLTLLIHLNLHPNIEIKGFYMDPFSSMQDFLKVLHRSWPKGLAPPLVSSFNLLVLTALRSLQNDIPLGYNLDEFNEIALETLVQEKLDSLHCGYQSLTPNVIQLCREKQIPLLAYTVNDPNQIQSLLNSGITAVLSDLTNQ